MTIRVLVADDQELVRTGLRMILDAQPEFQVVGEARNGREAVSMARELRPDVCLFDIRMPEVNGLEATRALAGAVRPSSRSTPSRSRRSAARPGVPLTSAR